MKMELWGMVAAGVQLMGLAVFGVADANWPQYQHDARRSGFTAEEVHHADRMILTVLKYQREDGIFYAGGGCSNHNALHPLRQWSKRYDMLMWDDIFHAMERFTGNLEQRYDPVSGYFYPPSDSRQKPQLEATELASVEIGNVIT